MRVRFFRHIGAAPVKGCWIWVGCVGADGYGKFVKDHRKTSAHRVAWELEHGPIGDSNMFVCHSCDNRLCVNVAHLFLGTAAENSRDMVSKKRNRVGVAHHRAKLIEADVREIRAALADGESGSVVARRFGVTQTTIYSIGSGRLWKHVS